MTADLNRDKLARVLALMSSPVDAEALAAARMAIKMVRDAQAAWEQVLLEPEPGPISFHYWRPTPSPPPPPRPPPPPKAETERKPKGWHGKRARDARKSAKAAQRAADQAARAARAVELALRCRERGDELTAFDRAILAHVLRGDPVDDGLWLQLQAIQGILDRIDEDRREAAE